MNKFILVVGLVILIIGVSTIFLTMSGIIQNTQGQHVSWYTDNSPVNIVQMQPKSFLLFNAVLDPKDRVHLNLEPDLEYPQQSVDSNIETRIHYTFSVDIRDSGNLTLKHADYDSESLWSGSITAGNSGLIDIYFQPPKYDAYQVFVTYKAWWEERTTGSWVFYDVGTDQITLSLGADLAVTKSTPNTTYLTGGWVLVAAGVVLSISTLVNRQRKGASKT